MDFNKIKEMGLEYAEKGRNAAMDLAERGRTQAKIVSEQTKLARAQRQLGALVRLKVVELLMLLSRIPQEEGTDLYCSTEQTELDI